MPNKFDILCIAFNSFIAGEYVSINGNMETAVDTMSCKLIDVFKNELP